MNNDKKIGILTFHASYNCGSMLQTYAMQTYLNKLGYNCEIINFSTDAQQKLYSLYSGKRTPKYLVRDFIFYVIIKGLRITLIGMRHLKLMYSIHRINLQKKWMRLVLMNIVV